MSCAQLDISWNFVNAPRNLFAHLAVARSAERKAIAKKGIQDHATSPNINLGAVIKTVIAKEFWGHIAGIQCIAVNWE